MNRQVKPKREDVFLLVLLMCVNCVLSSLFTDGAVTVEWQVEAGKGVACTVSTEWNQTSQLDYSNDLYEVDPTSLANMAEQCKLLQGKDANQVHRIWRRSIINILDGIYPGTKWCGHGNLASNVSDIGYYNLTDVCCREHDHCDEYILPGETKFGVHNDQQYTICSCTCDKRFRKCLQNVGTFTSRAVGSLFFNVVGIHCIETRTISLAGFVLGKRATLYPPEPYNQEAQVHTFTEVLAGNVSVTTWLGSLFGGK